MRMGDEQLQAAQMHSMAADEMEALIPTISDAADTQKGKPHVLFSLAVLSSVCLLV